jgi:hypothetical protein
LAFSQEAVPPEEPLTEAGQTEIADETGGVVPEEEPVGGVNIVEQTGSGFRISQRLNWMGDEFAGRYEVIIEIQEEGGYR